MGLAPVGPGETLVERESEFVAITRSLADARAGDGRLLLFEGPAGIGKTSLLEAARMQAVAANLTVLNARGGKLERDFPYGVVRQLLEPAVRAASTARRKRLLADAAALAAPTLLGPQALGAPPADPSFAVIHGLYWLVANLAAESPVALFVDDLHWSDAPSLRFLLHLARRLDGLPVALVGSIRSGDSGTSQGPLAELPQVPGTVLSEPAALSEEAVGRLLESAFAASPEPGFARACHAVTGGNPFLVCELASALLADGIEPTDASQARIETTAPRAIARTTLLRLGHVSEDGVALARAIAILGGDARLPQTAAIAGLDEHRALAAIDALVAADVIRSTGRLSFRHPIVHTAIYEELAPGARSSAHRQAAALLAAEGADLDAIAGHLLLAEPVGSADTISTLRDAATRALAVGAPDSAATYLSRALEEGCQGELRTSVLLELANAEKLARQPGARAHFEEVERLSDEASLRAQARIEQADAMIYAGRWDDGLTLLDAGIAELDGDIGPLALRGEWMRATMTAYDPRHVAKFERRRPVLREQVEQDVPGTRPGALLLSCVGCHRGERRDEVVALAVRGWDGGRYLSDGEPIELVPQGIWALGSCDELELADEIVEAVEDGARVTGSVLHHLIASGHRGWLEARRGNLARAAAELRWSCERSFELGLLFAATSMVSYAVDVLLERPDFADLVQLIETFELGPMSNVAAGAMLLDTRGQLRVAAGNTAGAIDDLRRSGEISDALGFVNPNGFVRWRSTLALALGPDQRGEALGLAAAELAQARRIAQPRGIGIALRALGVLDPDPDASRAHFQEAVAVLADSPARLEHARALVEQGAALRRRGERAAARQPLREGLDLATRCGALRLVEPARSELTVAGARPRRAHISGRDALTPSELRVALLAADGRTSQEIAQTLFVTTRTIDAHLNHAYSKLRINSRRQLAAALGKDGS
jgi:DNA-binding CsgD family transcriptional regulator